MRLYSISCLIMFALIAFSCTENDDVNASPLGPESIQNSRSYSAECHGNMTLIASAAIIYFATHGTYPANIEELGQPYSQMTCPECGLVYDLKGDQEHLSIFCLLPFEPNHGGIVDGVVTWPPDPEGFQNMCRANMRTIASQEVIYFAYNCKYTENLEELGLAGYSCQECGEEYILQVSGEGDEFYLECPLHTDPNHGSINNGVASWLDPTGE